jgi:hypothetical protein
MRGKAHCKQARAFTYFPRSRAGKAPPLAESAALSSALAVRQMLFSDLSRGLRRGEPRLGSCKSLTSLIAPTYVLMV